MFEDPKWYEADEWPPATDWAKVTPDLPLGQRGADDQALSIERERTRVASTDDPNPTRLERWFGVGRCGRCRRLTAMVEVPVWRIDYHTRRCIYCLRWQQKGISRDGL